MYNIPRLLLAVRENKDNGYYLLKIPLESLSEQILHRRLTE